MRFSFFVSVFFLFSVVFFLVLLGFFLVKWGWSLIERMSLGDWSFVRSLPLLSSNFYRLISVSAEVPWRSISRVIPSPCKWGWSLTVRWSLGGWSHVVIPSPSYRLLKLGWSLIEQWSLEGWSLTWSLYPLSGPLCAAHWLGFGRVLGTPVDGWYSWLRVMYIP